MVTDFFFPFSEQELLSLVLKQLVKCLLTAGPFMLLDPALAMWQLQIFQTEDWVFIGHLFPLRQV